MANKSSTVFYCGFCDMTLAKSEGVVYDTIHYCNDVCRKLGKKTSAKDEGMETLRGQLNDLRRGSSREQIKRHCKNAYEQHSRSYKKLLTENNPEHDLSMFKHALCLYGHIHNGNKEKALKALIRFNDWTAEMFEIMCVDPTNFTSQVIHGGDEEDVSGEENLRVAGIIYKLQREKFKLLIEQM